MWVWERDPCPKTGGQAGALSSGAHPAFPTLSCAPGAHLCFSEATLWGRE